MNAWDYYILYETGLFLIFLGLLCFLGSVIVYSLIDFLIDLNEVYQFIHFILHPISKIKSHLYGDLYLVKINGVWSACRGKFTNSNNLKVKYGIDNHVWTISNFEDYHQVPPGSEKQITNRIVELNISELKKRHPKFRDTRKSALDELYGYGYTEQN